MEPELYNRVIAVLLGLLLSIPSLMWYYRREVRKYRAQLAAMEEQQRRRSSKQGGAARATIKGQVAEQLAPLLPGFPYQPSDFRFLGQPIDFIVYRGLTQAKEGLGDIEEVVIGDIKMGSASLSPHQRAIKRAVEEGRVRWETIHIDQNFTIT